MNTNKLGLKDDEIKIVPYDPDWPQLFEAEKARIQGALSNCIIDIQHFGSTSVPEMPAKPIIDIILAIDDFAEIDNVIANMEVIGYERYEKANIPGDYTLGFGNPRQYWAHIVLHDSSNWRDNLYFRDQLRQKPKAAKEYFDLKSNLASNYRGIRKEYTAGKTAFVQSILKGERA